jgi:glycine cleavage system transcriptional repressor
LTTFALSAVGRDRPGIVAAVAQALAADGVNIEDSQMSILRGHFAMVLIVQAPPEVDAARLAADLRQVGDALDLEAIALTPVADAAPAAASEPSHLVSVYGADHPGIVHAVAAGLVEADVNITGLTTRLVGDEGAEPLYVMLLEVAAGDADPAALLAPVAAAQGVEVSVRALETATL